LCPEFCPLHSCLHHNKVWASHSSDHIAYCPLVCDVLWYGMYVCMYVFIYLFIYLPFWMNLLPPVSIFNPEDGDSRFFINVSITTQMAVYYVIKIFTSLTLLCVTPISSTYVLC
jgi:hypothetical protein